MRRAVVAFACPVAFAALPPLPSRATNGSSPRSPTATSSRSTPTAAGCARCGRRPRVEINGLAWSPDGNRLAFSYAGQIAVFDLPAAARR